MVDKNDFDISYELGNSIRKVRKQNKMTMEQLSKKSGVSVLTIGNIENGKTNPTINILWKLSSALNVPLSQLLGYSNISDKVMKTNIGYAMNDFENGWIVRPVFQEDNIEVFQVCLKANSTHVTQNQPLNSTEVVTVMKGKIMIHIDEKQYNLDSFDTINFKSGMLHEYVNDSNEDSLLSIVVKY